MWQAVTDLQYNSVPPLNVLSHSCLYRELYNLPGVQGKHVCLCETLLWNSAIRFSFVLLRKTARFLHFCQIWDYVQILPILSQMFVKKKTICMPEYTCGQPRWLGHLILLIIWMGFGNIVYVSQCKYWFVWDKCTLFNKTTFYCIHLQKNSLHSSLFFRFAVVYVFTVWRKSGCHLWTASQSKDSMSSLHLCNY